MGWERSWWRKCPHMDPILWQVRQVLNPSVRPSLTRVFVERLLYAGTQVLSELSSVYLQDFLALYFRGIYGSGRNCWCLPVEEVVKVRFELPCWEAGSVGEVLSREHEGLSWVSRAHVKRKLGIPLLGKETGRSLRLTCHPAHLISESQFTMRGW